MDTLTVVIKPYGKDGNAWFCQGIEVDYTSQGLTLDEAKENFTGGLVDTIKLRTERGHDPLPPPVSDKVRDEHLLDAGHYDDEVDPSPSMLSFDKIRWRTLTQQDHWWLFHEGALVPTIAPLLDWTYLHDILREYFCLYSSGPMYLIEIDDGDEHDENIICADFAALVEATNYLKTFRDFWTCDD